MPPLLVGAGRLLVAPLVVAVYLAGVTDLPRPALPAEQRRAAGVQPPAHLLPRHPWVSPPQPVRMNRHRNSIRTLLGPGWAASRSYTPGGDPRCSVEIGSGVYSHPGRRCKISFCKPPPARLALFA